MPSAILPSTRRAHATAHNARAILQRLPARAGSPPLRRHLGSPSACGQQSVGGKLGTTLYILPVGGRLLDNATKTKHTPTSASTTTFKFPRHRHTARVFRKGRESAPPTVGALRCQIRDGFGRSRLAGVDCLWRSAPWRTEQTVAPSRLPARRATLWKAEAGRRRRRGRGREGERIGGSGVLAAERT